MTRRATRSGSARAGSGARAASRARPRSLRDRVIRAAVDHVAAHGPEGLSFRQIAADAGVSHQAPYHHFGDRGAIFAEIAREGFVMFTEAMRAPAGRGDHPDLAVRLCERYVDFALRHRGYFRVMFRADLCRMDESPETRRAADEAFQVLLDAVVEILGDSASVAEVRVQATAMWSLAHGLATLLTDGPLEQKIGAVRDARALARGVALLLQGGVGAAQRRR